MAPRTDRTTRIPSGVASVLFILRNVGNLRNWSGAQGEMKVDARFLEQLAVLRENWNIKPLGRGPSSGAPAGPAGALSVSPGKSFIFLLFWLKLLNKEYFCLIWIC